MTVATVATRQALGAWAVGSTPTSQNSLIVGHLREQGHVDAFWALHVAPTYVH